MRVFTRHSIMRKSKCREHLKLSKYREYWCGVFRGRYGRRSMLPAFYFDMLHRAFSYRNGNRRCHMRHQTIAYGD